MAESPPSVSTPEHPNWMPWWVRYAEYDGRCAVLADVHWALREFHHDTSYLARSFRYRVAVIDALPIPCPQACCGQLGWLSSAVRRQLWATDSLDEALAAFAEAERVLLGRQS